MFPPPTAAAAATASRGAGSRRDKNKLATRAAIANSALSLVRTKGPGHFTAEEIAEDAGVSRRTFFNYFPSAEAALAVHIEDFLDNVLPLFLDRPAEEPLVDSMLSALTSLADPAHLERTAELFHLAEDNPQLHRFQLEAWGRAEHKIVAAIEERIGTGADTLYLAALVGSVFSTARAALSIWLQRRGGDLSADSMSALRQLLIDALEHLRSGFAH